MTRIGGEGSGRWTRWLVLIALVVAVNGVAAGWASAEMSSGRAGTAQDAADRDNQAFLPSGPLQTVLVHSQDFEGTTFPPAGWMRVDAHAYEQGLPPQYVWSRETCDVDPARGGSAAAWAVGDGDLGSLLPCGGSYPDVVDSWLVYQGIDASSFSGGLQVTLDYKIDEPRQQSFLVCAWADGPGHSCFASPVTQSAWSSFGPMHFPHVAGHANVEFWVLYRDRDPQGTNFGVFVDNILLEGITGAMTSTPTNTSPPTTTAPSPTEGPTATTAVTPLPSPTGSPSAEPSAEPSSTVTALPSITASPTTATGVVPSNTPMHTAVPSESATPQPSVTASPSPTRTAQGTALPTTTPTSTSQTPIVTPPPTGSPTEPTEPTNPTPGTMEPTLPPPVTSLPTETSPPTTPAATSTGAPTSETQTPMWWIYIPYVSKGD